MPGQYCNKKLCCQKHRNESELMDERQLRNEEQLARERREINEKIEHLKRNKTKEWRTAYRRVIEKGGIMYSPSELPYPYVLVKKVPAIAIARVYGETQKTDANGKVHTFLRCDLYSRKPLEENGNSSNTDFELDFKDFPVEKSCILQDLPEPVITRDENNFIQELKFTNDPTARFVDTGIY